MKAYTTYAEEFFEYAAHRGLAVDSDVALASFMRYAVMERPKKLGRSTVTSVIPAAVGHIFRYGKTPTQSVLVREAKKAVIHMTEAPSEGRLPLTVC